MKLIARLLLFLIILGVVSCTQKYQKQKNSSIQNSELSQMIDSLFTQLVADDLFNGEILVARGQQVIIQKYFGNADLSKKTGFSKKSVFEIASVSCTSSNKFELFELKTKRVLIQS